MYSLFNCSFFFSLITSTSSLLTPHSYYISALLASKVQQERKNRLHEGFIAHAKVEVYWIENDPTPNQVKIMWESVTSNYLYRLYVADDVSRPYTNSGWISFSIG